MHMHKRQGRAVSSGFSFEGFYTAVLSDLQKFLTEEVAAWLLLSVGTPPVFRDRVELVHTSLFATVAYGDKLDFDPKIPTAVSGTLEQASNRVILEAFLAVNQLQALLKKNPDYGVNPVKLREEAALEKFRSSELRCGRTNRKLRFYRKHWSRAPLAQQLVNAASLHAQRILGEFEEADLVDSFDHASLPAKATFDHTSGHQSFVHKMKERHTVTGGCKNLLRLFMASSSILERELEGPLKTIEGDRLAHVPKSWNVTRLIFVPPSWNLFLQKGVDVVMRKRLRREGVDLTRQDRNYGPCREGSIGSRLVTIDLSSASDSVSTELVRTLVPPSWFRIMDQLRSPKWTADRKSDRWETFEKFSGMGNAFTFPLESLVFYTLALAACDYIGVDKRDVRVYGDDIIVPQEAALLLIETLRYAGFQTNTQKSFVFGKFRESCGRDFLQGVNIRPVFLDSLPSRPSDIYSLYNRLLIGSMVPLPTTLNLLQRCVTKPHMGPWYHQLAETAGAEWVTERKPRSALTVFDSLRSVWSPGSAVSIDSYFIEWHFEGRRYSYLQSYVPELRVHDQTRLRLSLMGVKDGKVYDVEKLKYRERSREFPVNLPRITELTAWQRKLRLGIF